MKDLNLSLKLVHYVSKNLSDWAMILQLIHFYIDNLSLGIFFVFLVILQLP